jgi:acetylornithine deacetylase/succinyl-diaminopimelate desuccinylase-like protein
MELALKYVSNQMSAFVRQLETFLRIPSVSTDANYARDVLRGAEWLRNELLRIGIREAALIETPGHPIIFAKHGNDRSKPTVLCYGHYDVQPPEPYEFWKTPPFEPTLKNGILYARGASDDKGQLFMQVKAVEALLNTKEGLPVNLKFLFEGEEEVGSTNLASFVADHKDLLDADVVLVCDTALFAPDVPSITCALRGLAYVEVELTAASRDLHSGVYGGAVENPANALAKLIADLHDEHHRITIDGFYDDVKDLTPEDREEWARLPFDEDEWKESIGVSEALTEEGYTVLEATTARPTLDVNGIWSGYQGEGAKTVLPARASAKISMRLVPDQKMDDIVEKTRAHFERHTPPTMKLGFKVLHGGSPIVIDTSSAAMKAASDAMETVLGKKPVLTREGGSIPVVADFKNILGLDSILMGFGLYTDAIHSPNEHFGIDRFEQGIKSLIHFFTNFGHLWDNDA